MVIKSSGALRASICVLAAVASMGLSGCKTGSSASCCAEDSSFTVERADSDRALLARLVGDWRFEGSWNGTNGTKHSVQGRAAGVLVNNYFVNMDIQTTSGELAGRTSRDEGTILFASEPGIGLTASSWGDASPQVYRMVGRSEAGGSVLSYTPARGASNAVAFVLRFDGDSRFTADITGGPNGQGSASYTFTRVTDK